MTFKPPCHGMWPAEPSVTSSGSPLRLCPVCRYLILILICPGKYWPDHVTVYGRMAPGSLWLWAFAPDEAHLVILCIQDLSFCAFFDSPLQWSTFLIPFKALSLPLLYCSDNFLLLSPVPYDRFLTRAEKESQRRLG